MSCRRCEDLPDRLPESGTLHIAPPEEMSEARLRSFLKAAEVSFSSSNPGLIEIRLTPGLLQRLCEEYFLALSEVERRDTRCLLLGPGQELSIARFFQARPLEEVLGLTQGSWLIDLLAQERLTTFFHPIVNCQDPGAVFAYECLARGFGVDGSIIPPFKLFSAARSGNLMFQLDRAARISAIRRASEHGITGTLFINFNPTAIYSPEHCLKTTMRAVEEADLEPSSVVFEVVESEEIHDTVHLTDILRFYREHGFRVALDDLGAGYGSLNLLSKLQPDFIKLDMDLVRGVDQDRYKSQICRNLLLLSRDLGIRAVAEGVETNEEWRWLQDNGGDLVQGYLFGRPSPTPERAAVPTS